MLKRSPAPWIGLALAGLGYFLLARFGMALFALQPSNITLLWLPSGLALVICLHWGRPALAVIALASFCANLAGMTTANPWATVLHTGVAAAADTLVGYLTARQYRLHLPGGLQWPGDLLTFVLQVCLLPTLICGFILGGNLLLGGYLPASKVLDTIGMLVLADSLGILLVFPLYLHGSQNPPHRQQNPQGQAGSLPGLPLRERKYFLGGSLLLTALLFTLPTPYSGLLFLVLPLLLLLALYLRPLGVHALTVLVVIVVVATTAQGWGPLVQGSANQTSFYLAAFAYALVFGVLLTLLQNHDIAERTQLSADLAQKKEWLLEAQRIAHVGHWRLDLQTGVLTWSDEIFRIFDIAPDQFEATFAAFLARVHPEDRCAVTEAYEASVKNRQPYTITHRLLLPDGRLKHVQEAGETTYGPDGQPLFSLGTVQDITERTQAEHQLRQAASVFSAAREGISIADPHGTILDVNEAFTRITGYTREEVIGRNSNLLSSGLHGQDFYAAMWRDLKQHGNWSGEIWNRRKTGEIYAELITISAICNEAGETLRFVALFSDITAIKEHARQLEHIAHYDALTDLPNRVLLADRLNQAMVQSQRRQQVLAVVYLDLDGFKAINDTHGHQTGDRLLTRLAGYMKQALREGDTLARLGGDEFVAVLLDLPNAEAALPLMDRLLAAAHQPVYEEGHTLLVSASLGISFYPQAEAVDADQLLRQADQAMYQAKLAGRNQYHIFDADHDRTVRGHHETLVRIRQGLQQNEFVLHYQPKVNMRTGTVIGAEALIRWQHPERGLLAPGTFLPMLENQALAIELDQWVLDTALCQLDTWHRMGCALPVSINIGGLQLQQANFVSHLQHRLAAHPLVQAGDLELEVLESSALDDVAQVSSVIRACHALGVAFALDDFGTGYSSLTYLKRLPASVLKIDQSFVRDMLVDPDDLAILQGVLGLALAFRRTAIAEGVETVAHGELLLRLGCELAQGHAIARPMPAAQLPDWMARWHPPASWQNQPKISRDDLPVLFAAVEHRAWLARFESHLRHDTELPPLDCHACRLGQWLTHEGADRYGQRPVFREIDTLHREIHQQATRLVHLKAQARMAEALADLAPLHVLRDRLLEHLDTLSLAHTEAV